MTRVVKRQRLRASLSWKFKFKIGAMAKKDEIVKEENRETKARDALAR